MRSCFKSIILSVDIVRLYCIICEPKLELLFLLKSVMAMYILLQELLNILFLQKVLKYMAISLLVLNIT